MPWQSLFGSTTTSPVGVEQGMPSPLRIVKHETGVEIADICFAPRSFPFGRYVGRTRPGRNTTSLLEKDYGYTTGLLFGIG